MKSSTPYLFSSLEGWYMDEAAISGQLRYLMLECASVEWPGLELFSTYIFLDRSEQRKYHWNKMVLVGCKFLSWVSSVRKYPHKVGQCGTLYSSASNSSWQSSTVTAKTIINLKILVYVTHKSPLQYCFGEFPIPPFVLSTDCFLKIIFCFPIKGLSLQLELSKEIQLEISITYHCHSFLL